jgi:hypothetical protein
VRGSSRHHWFLRRIRRRWVAWRVVEFAGIGAASAAAVGLILVPVLVWRAEPATSFAVMLLAIGAVAGALWGATRRPTLLQTAVEADRQLGLHDLLSTALVAQQAGDGAFADVVLAHAESICRTRSPNELIVQRLGGRVWGGIGIVTALLLTISMMSTQPGVTQARSGVNRSNPQTTASNVVEPDSIQQTSTIAAHPETAGVSQHQTPDDPGDVSGDGHEASAHAQARSATTGDGSGTSAGRTESAQVPTLQHSAVSRDNAERLSSDAVSSSLPAAPNRPGRGIPPWRSSNWSVSRDAAMKDVQSGRTPDAYRDLVREYFSNHHDDEH